MSWWKRTIYEEFGPRVLEKFEKWHEQKATPYGRFLSLCKKSPEDVCESDERVYQSAADMGYCDQTKDDLGYEYFYGPSDSKEEIKRRISARKYEQKTLYVAMSSENCRLYDLGRKQARQDTKAFRAEIRIKSI